MNATPPACPTWCESSDEVHWQKLSPAMPWEAGHERAFGPLVTVSVGHEVHADGTQRWWSAEMIVRPHRVETEDGCSQYQVPDALNLASHLAEAGAFVLALEQPTPAV